MRQSSWKRVTHCGCHCKVNSAGSLLVTEAVLRCARRLGVGACAAPVMLLPVRWLALRANPVGNRNAFCLGMEGGGGG